jgi:hypothetical protein
VATLVSLVGLALIFVGILGIVNPQRLADTVRAWPVRGRFLTVVGVRLVIGITFIFAAPATRFPTVILVLGVVAVVAAVALILVGSKRVDALVEWWFRQPAGFTRGWSMLAVLLGVGLVYAGV